MKFNGILAAPNSWSETSIATLVPFGATTGPVVVSVNGVDSNGVNFTANVGAISGTVTRASDSAPFAGARVELHQGGQLKHSTTSGIGGAYTLNGLPSGTFELRILRNGYTTAVFPAVVVTLGSTTTQNAALSAGTPIRYAYDEMNRLMGVAARDGETAAFRYDAAGNLLGIDRTAAGQVAIVDFSPERGLPGDSVSISGSGFSAVPSENTVRFNGVAASVTSSTTNSIAVTVPAGATSGPISVTTLSGSATSSSAFTIVEDVVIAGSLNGSPTLVTIDTPGQRARVTFSGTQGQRAGILLSSVGITESDVSVLKPDGTNLIGPTLIGLSGGFMEALLPTAGLYTVVIDPRLNNVGSVTLRLYDSSDITLSGAHGGPAVPVGLAIPGQNARIQFNGAAGAHVAFYFENNQIPQSDISMLKPDGSLFYGPLLVTAASQSLLDHDTILPVTGTYTVTVDPRVSYTGGLSLTVVADLTATIQLDSTGSNSTNTFGQNMLWTFTGAAGQRVSIRGNLHSDEGLFSATLSLQDGAGATLRQVSGSSSFCYTGNGCLVSLFIDTYVLPANATYTIYLNPTGIYTGLNRVDLYEVNPDATASTTINGPAVDVPIVDPGQNGRVSFPGATGQQVTVHIPRNDPCNLTVSLLSPAGAVLASVTRTQCGTFDLPPRVLPENGTYAIDVDPTGASTGTVTTSVTSP